MPHRVVVEGDMPPEAADAIKDLTKFLGEDIEGRYKKLVLRMEKRIDELEEENTRLQSVVDEMMEEQGCRAVVDKIMEDAKKDIEEAEEATKKAVEEGTNSRKRYIKDELMLNIAGAALFQECCAGEMDELEDVNSEEDEVCMRVCIPNDLEPTEDTLAELVAGMPFENDPAEVERRGKIMTQQHRELVALRVYNMACRSASRECRAFTSGERRRLEVGRPRPCCEDERCPNFEIWCRVKRD